MSDEFTTNENGSKTPEETNFQDYTAPENEIVQNETSQMTQEQPETSYGDITRYYTEKGVLFYGKALIRPMLAQLLRNPAYVRADML